MATAVFAREVSLKCLWNVSGSLVLRVRVGDSNSFLEAACAIVRRRPKTEDRRPKANGVSCGYALELGVCCDRWIGTHMIGHPVRFNLPRLCMTNTEAIGALGGLLYLETFL